ncbi:aminopeptidase P family N-terminal domain-containing protein [Sporomusa carbonis]
MRNPCTDRITKAQQMMAETNLDLLLVTNRENLIYFYRFDPN